MRNLIAFFRRFQLFLVFAILQIVALSTYVSYSEFPRLQLLSTTTDINATVISVSNDVSKHFRLEQTNRKLEWENRWLRQQMKQSKYKLDKGIVSIDDTSYQQKYNYIPATVVSSTFDRRNNYMTIDAGSVHGIKVGDGVFSSKGVVGRIHAVNGRYALVKTILSKNFNLDVMLQNNGAFGLLKWDGVSPKICQISGISNDMRVKKWSKVVTKGGSNIFPKGIPVGKVYMKKALEGRPLWDIHLYLAEDFRSIQHVYVVNNLHLKEIQDLQKTIPVDKEESEL